MEFPSLNKVNLSGDMPVVAVNIGADKDTVEKYIKKNNLNMPVVIDTNFELAGAFEIRFFPTNVILDKTGAAVYNQAGVLDEESLNKIIDSYK